MNALPTRPGGPTVARLNRIFGSASRTALGLLASVIPLVLAILVKNDFEDLYGVLGAFITVNHETSSVKLGACKAYWLANASMLSRMDSCAESGENGGLDDIGSKYEFDMMEE
jgi:hypothetical protein